jgi:hypothetical protein
MPSPAITAFLARLPPVLAASFSAEQLAAIELHFAMRYVANHRINWRLRLPFSSLYFVLLAGHDQRRRET